MTEAKNSDIPLNVGYFKTSNDGDLKVNSNLFRKAIGSLLYVSNNSRPDISAAVSILSRKITNPNQSDWTEVKRMIKYLKGTKNLKLYLFNPKKLSTFSGYSDADWGNNSNERKSTSGCIVTINGAPIAWFSRKQNCTALSSTEAEMIALVECCKEITYLNKVSLDFNFIPEHTPTFYEDNQSVLKLLES